MDNFGEKVTIITLKKHDDLVLKHTINISVFYDWVLNITMFIVMFFSVFNLVKFIIRVVM